MATKEKAPKAEKAPKKEKSVVVDSSILNGFRELVSTSTASIWGFISSTYSKMSEGESSVRIARASIKEGEKSGKHPVVKSSQVEGFGTALKVNKLQGATEQPIATILKVSMRAQRVAGVEGVDSLIEGIKTYAGFIDRLESAEESKAEEKAEATEAEESEKSAEIDLAGITWEALAEIVIKKAKMEKNMVDATCEVKLAGQATAIFNTLVKNTQAKAKVNA
jgi:hypothetical protein